MFDRKIVIVVREDLAVWQKLNVAAFLTSGIVGADVGLLGEPYADAAGNAYHRLIGRPMMVLTADGEGLRRIHRRALDRGTELAVYIEEMFSTGHDAANRQAVAQVHPEDMNLVDLALCDARNRVAKITKGARMHD